MELDINDIVDLFYAARDDPHLVPHQIATFILQGCWWGLEGSLAAVGGFRLGAATAIAMALCVAESGGKEFKLRQREREKKEVRVCVGRIYIYSEYRKGWTGSSMVSLCRLTASIPFLIDSVLLFSFHPSPFTLSSLFYHMVLHNDPQSNDR